MRSVLLIAISLLGIGFGPAAVQIVTLEVSADDVLQNTLLSDLAEVKLTRTTDGSDLVSGPAGRRSGLSTCLFPCLTSDGG